MIEKRPRGPDLSVVIVTRDSFQSIRRTVEHLHRQTRRDRIELIVVAPSAAALRDAGDALGGFGRRQVVEAGPIHSRGRAAARGVQAASAPLVGFVENHSFPDPSWAEALIRAHRGPWACVGPAVRNANPTSLTSRANFLFSYGRWVEPVKPGPSDLLPFHNSTYKREFLEPYRDRLASLLDAEGELQADLLARGACLYLEPAAGMAHTNEAVLGISLRLLFCTGRTFGASRCRTWSRLRRAAYIAGAPLIPLVNLPRILRDVRRCPEGRDRFARLFPLIMLHACAHAAGEATGYAAGPGRARRFINDHEFLAGGRDPRSSGMDR